MTDPTEKRDAILPLQMQLSVLRSPLSASGLQVKMQKGGRGERGGVRCPSPGLLAGDQSL